jgi:hypothetical protein
MKWFQELMLRLFPVNHHEPDSLIIPATKPKPELKVMTFKPTTLQEAFDRYGFIANNVWPDEVKWMTMYFVPDDIKANWVNTATGKTINKIYLNKDMLTPLTQAMDNLKTRGLLSELKTFDGCFMIRMIRGSTTTPSTHSYGLAIDVNAATNALGQVPQLSAEFVACFTDVGFVWGGNFSRKDGMHFQWAGW